MNRGFIYYFKRGLNAAWKALIKEGKYLRYYIYYFAALLGRCIPVIGCLFPVADVRRSKILRNESDMPISRAFGGVETGNAVGTTILAVIIKFLITAGGVIAFSAAGVLFGFIGLSIGRIADMSKPYILLCILAAPFAVAAVVYVIFVLLCYAPVAYIIDSNKDLRVSGVLTAASETMRRGGKATCFLNVFVPFIIKFLYLLLAGGILFLITLIQSQTLCLILVIVWILAATAVYVVFAPVFTLTATVANTCLFDDIALDPASMNNRTKGLFITHCTSENTLSDKGRDSNLESLFEHEEVRVVPPDTNYVPPTDYAEKMHTYNPETDENGTQENQSENEAGDLQ